jgi:hypothetical protein
MTSAESFFWPLVIYTGVGVFCVVFFIGLAMTFLGDEPNEYR